MTTENLPPDRWRAAEVLAVLVRCILGALFIYMGLNKALHPVEFLKLVRQYDVVPQPLLLNLIASTLPWFEVLCGIWLLLGLAVRGTAVVLVLMLIPFTILVFLRAWSMHRTGGLPFCAIKFDCGCGAGEVLICRKLAENIFLIALAAWLTCSRGLRLSLRHSFF
jgi:uncharacterized membrane protein YphA (DoxX/SURF4 family)